MQFQTLGNACHAISSTSILVYTVAAMLYARPGSEFFDDDWLDHGFCVVNKDVPYWNSHDLCLYFDAVLVALGAAVYYVLRGAPGMKSADEMMMFNLIGHLGHGVAHGFIGAEYRSGRSGGHRGTALDRIGEMDGFEIAQKFAVLTCFWFGLLRGLMPKVSNRTVGFVTVPVVVGGLFVKEVLGFAFVQAVLTVAFASTQLNLPKKEKDFSYAAFGVSAVPISLIPWIESTVCQTVASKIGGHLIYDVSIPILLTIAYCASWCHYNNKGKVKLI